MHAGYGLFLYLILGRLFARTNQDTPDASFLTITDGYDVPTEDESLADVPLVTSTLIEPSRFFRNEPVPLASSVVDDLTALASVVYALSVVILVFIFLAWITHYHAPCSSVITSVLSTITGLPEPIIRSVALCGSCCVWCESTWLFRRIHQFNVCVSTRVGRFTSVTCKLIFDTICPCCQPPDTPSQRSIIGTLDRLTSSSNPMLLVVLSGSLPASIIALIDVPDVPKPPSSKPIVTGQNHFSSFHATKVSSYVVVEPTSALPSILTTKVDLYPPSTTDTLVANRDSFTVHVAPLENSSSRSQAKEPAAPPKKRRRRRPRKRNQLKQRSTMNDPLPDDASDEGDADEEDDDDDREDEDENDAKVY